MQKTKVKKKLKKQVKKRPKLSIQYEIFVDNFAGAGGASTGIEHAIGRSVDVAINHDPVAIAMHEANHPNTKHYCQDVFEVDPREVAAGRPVALVWLSPDCTHHSKAKGGKPVSKKIRGLAWVAVRWAATVKPRVIMLENVEEFQTWGPLIMTEKGPVPDKKKKGVTFKSFVKALEKEGYHVEFKELRACDYGANTTRKRLFLIARCDGQPIVWPSPTHGPRNSEDVLTGKLKPYHSAAECIDWSIPSKSIFGREKPLVPNTMKRIARGLKKFVLNSENPFFIDLATSKGEETNQRKNIQKNIEIHIRSNIHSNIYRTTQFTDLQSINEVILISPTLLQMGYTLSQIGHQGKQSAVAWVKKDYLTCTGDDLNEPLSTITSSSNHHSLMITKLEHLKNVSSVSPQNTTNNRQPTRLMAAYLSKTYGGSYTGAGIDLNDPTDTITAVDHHAFISTFVEKISNEKNVVQKEKANDPIIHNPDIKMEPAAEVSEELQRRRDIEILDFLREYVGEDCFLEADASFISKYYGSDIGQDLHDPMHTVPTKDRFALITVLGEHYRIVDIQLRMLKAHELKIAQSVPKTYVIDTDKNGKKISATEQKKKLGNMVIPICAEILVRANLPEHCCEGPYHEQVELLNADFGWSG